MPEGKVKLQVVVAGGSLIAIGGIESGGIGKERIGIDAAVGSLSFVTRIEGDTCAQVRVPAALHLIPANQSPLLIFIIEQLFIGVERFLMVEGWVVFVLAVEHIDVAVVDDITEHTQSGIPFQAFVDRALDIARDADEVAFVLVEHAAAVGGGVHLLRLLRPVMQGVVILGLIAVIAVEVAHSIGQIGGVKRQSVARYEVFGVVVEAEDTMVFGGIGRLNVERVNVFGILTAIAVVINVGEHTTLEAVVGIIGDRRQDTEVPAGLDFITQGVHLHFLFSLRVSSSDEQRQCYKGEQ